MKKLYQHKRNGFSLVELSVTLLIVSILIVSIAKGSKMIRESKIASAAALTQSSAVNTISGLALWLDATDNENLAAGSVGSGIYNNVFNNNFVTNWRDRNTQSGNKITLSALANANRPTYLENGINDLPSLSFTSGSTQTLYADNFNFPFANYSIFAVFTTSAETSNRAILGLVKSANDPGVAFHLQSTGVFRTLHRTPSGTSGGDAFTSSSSIVGLNTNYVVSFIRNYRYSTSKVWLNNTNIINATPTLANLEQTNYRLTVGSLYGASDFINYFDGYIGEIIVFNRAVKDSERQSIEEYLSKKWRIKLN